MSTTPRLWPVAGLKLGSVAAGIKKPNHQDLTLIELAEGSKIAGVFTQNAFCAAPVTLAKQHLAHQPRYLLINTGNANAGTGKQGDQDALASCEAVAATTGCQSKQVLPFSTGVIGESLPMERLLSAIPELPAVLHEDNWIQAASAIMTTDTRPKGVSRQLNVAGKTISITGIAKGAGMIRPNMATMLAFVATDAELEQEALQNLLTQGVNQSFNRITVDGDTSTNDACMLIATGQSGVVLNEQSSDWQAFAEAVCAVLQQLAQLIIRDAEGATKFISLQINQAQAEQEALQVAYTIAHSPLVKTAFFASDPNWGRILAAVGRSGLTELDINAIRIYLGDLCIVEDGGRSASYREELGQAEMDKTDIVVRVDLGRGESSALVWTSDLSHDYVRINAEYRT